MSLQQLDRLVVFCMGMAYVWIGIVIWKEMVPDVKEWIQDIKNDSTEATAESREI